MDRFETCHAITAKWEGGWSDHPDDPGGKTMFGITQAVYAAFRKSKFLPVQSVRNITRAEALEIYRSQYWNKCGAGFLFSGVDLAIYDVSVNSGVGRGAKLRTSTSEISAPDARVKAICRARLSFLQSLKIWKTFGKGWGRRVADIEARGVMMALEAVGLTKAVQSEAAAVEVEAADADLRKAAKAKNAAASTTPIGAGASITTTDHVTLYLIGGLVAIGIVAALIFYARQKAAQARAEAYLEHAKG